jgi:hypothetical protein
MSTSTNVIRVWSPIHSPEVGDAVHDTPCVAAAETSSAPLPLLVTVYGTVTELADGHRPIRVVFPVMVMLPDTRGVVCVVVVVELAKAGQPWGVAVTVRLKPLGGQVPLAGEEQTTATPGAQLKTTLDANVSPMLLA